MNGLSTPSKYVCTYSHSTSESVAVKNFSVVLTYVVLLVCGLSIVDYAALVVLLICASLVVSL